MRRNSGQRTRDLVFWIGMENDMNIQVKIENGFVEDIMSITGDTNVCSIMSQAFSFYAWYLSELKKNRIVLSCNRNGDDIHRLIF